MAKDDNHSDKKRIDVGFAGGGAVSARVSEDSLGSLQSALKDSPGWYELDTADGPLALDLRQVVFVQMESSEHKIGFSSL